MTIELPTKPGFTKSINDIQNRVSFTHNIIEPEPMPSQEELSKLQLYFGPDNDNLVPVTNVYLQTEIPKMENVNCRIKYTIAQFKKVMVTYNALTGLHIVGTLYNKDKESVKRNELFIPGKYIVSIGVDAEGCCDGENRSS